MKNKFLILVILFLLPIFIISVLVKTIPNKKEIENNKIKYKFEVKNIEKTPLESNINIKVSVNNTIQEMNLEEYIVGVLAGEMPASFELEALKAQAVAARTYAIYKINNTSMEYDVIDTINDQVYLTKDEMKDKWGIDYQLYYDKIYEAVASTQNQVIKQDGKVIKAFFFSMSNGYTEDSIAVFKEGNIKSVESPFDNESLEKFKVTTKFTLNELKQKLSLNSENINIEVIKRSDTNRVQEVKVNNKTYTGIEFRKLLTLRSTDFSLEKLTDGYNITTKGYGHGVGMSQYGANGMAKNGSKYDEILKYYYQETKIETL